jgi:hypothetical protein
MLAWLDRPTARPTVRRPGAGRGTVLVGLLAGSAVLLAGCGSPTLTTPAPAPARTGTPSATGGGALGGAVSKLDLISQDGCQTDPPEQVYPGCDRYLAELRSAVATVQGNSAGLANAARIQGTAAELTGALGAFDRDGCGGGPYSSGASNAPLCVADLGRVRAGLSTLLAETRGVSGG